VTSGAFSVNMILTGAFSILAGRIADRFGPRLVLTISGLIVGIAFILMSRVSTVWQYYLDYGVLLSIGLSGIVVPLMSNVSRWFTRGRGLASGVVISGIGLGVIVMPQVTNNLISTYDWRKSFIILGMLQFKILLQLARLTLLRLPAQMCRSRVYQPCKLWVPGNFGLSA
jgi:MFS family permease